jgi:hypothetical protein
MGTRIVRGIQFLTAMEKQDFALEPAYAFLRLKGFSTDATAIRNAKPGSNDLLIKRAMVLSVVTENGLLESFLADRWPKGAPPEVQPELERLKKIHERYQQFKPLTCEQIGDALRNIDPGLVDTDLALRSAVKATQRLPPSFGRFVAEVCVVADWGSFRLQGFPFKDRVAMAREIESCWSVLQPMQSHHADDSKARVRAAGSSIFSRRKAGSRAAPAIHQAAKREC